jgi:hypothetical protein
MGLFSGELPHRDVWSTSMEKQGMPVGFGVKMRASWGVSGGHHWGRLCAQDSIWAALIGRVVDLKDEGWYDREV